MLLCSDFDGTLHSTQDEQTLERNLAAINEFRTAGHHFAIITGRNFTTMTKKLPNWQTVVDYMITDNGGAFYDQQGNLIYVNNLRLIFVQKLLDLVKDRALPVYYAPKYCTMAPSSSGNEIIKLRFYCNSVAKMWRLVQTIEQKQLPVKTLPWPRYGYSNLPNGDPPEKYPAFLDIVPSTSGKDAAVQLLAELTNQSERIVTIGDDYNDLAMLERFEGYLIDTADEEVKAAFRKPTISSVAQLVSQLLSP